MNGMAKVETSGEAARERPPTKVLCANPPFPERDVVGTVEGPGDDRWRRRARVLVRILDNSWMRVIGIHRCRNRRSPRRPTLTTTSWSKEIGRASCRERV